MANLQVEIFGDQDVPRLQRNINKFCKGKAIEDIQFQTQPLGHEKDVFIVAMVVYERREKDESNLHK